MTVKPVPLITPLADTQYEIDTREAPRHGCPGRPVLKIVVQPSFVALLLEVLDISFKGTALLCQNMIPPRTRIALLWDFGRPHCWRTLRAKVVRTAPHGRNGWIIGCKFEEWLSPNELASFLREVIPSGDANQR